MVDICCGNIEHYWTICVWIHSQDWTSECTDAVQLDARHLWNLLSLQRSTHDVSSSDVLCIMLWLSQQYVQLCHLCSCTFYMLFWWQEGIFISALPHHCSLLAALILLYLLSLLLVRLHHLLYKWLIVPFDMLHLVSGTSFLLLSINLIPALTVLFLSSITSTSSVESPVSLFTTPVSLSLPS